MDSEQSELIITKLRSSGIGAFRYILDNPIVLMASIGYETSIQATKIAARVRSLRLATFATALFAGVRILSNILL